MKWDEGNRFEPYHRRFYGFYAGQKEIVAQVARQIKEALVVSSDSALVEGNRLDGGESAGINN